MDLKLHDKRALVLGGSKGIGFAIAKGLVNEGAKVCILSRNETNLEVAQSELNSLSKTRVIGITADVGDAASLDVALDEVISLLGWPDIIICNSGGPPIGTFEQHDEDVWYQAFEQQLMMIIRCVKKFSGHMVQSNGGVLLIFHRP